MRTQPPSVPTTTTTTTPAERVAQATWRPRLPRVQELGLLLVVLVLAAVLSFYGWRDARPGRPNTFLNFDNLVGGVATPMSYYAIMAVGVTLVIITGGIDISVGSIMALSALASAAVLKLVAEAAPTWLVVPVAVLVPSCVGALCGLINGGLIVSLNLHPFIVTLGTMSIFRGLANVLPWFAEKTLVVPAHTMGFMRVKVGGVEAMPLIVMLLFAFAGWFYLRLTVAGRETYAVGGNEEAARYSGLPVKRIKLRVYALAGMAAGVAGMVSLGRFGTASTNTAAGYELTVIAAAVVGGASLAGGRGSAVGAVLGTLVIALIENAIDILHLDPEYRLIIIGSAIVVAVSLDRLSERLRARRAVLRFT